jgi:hypothetical protein
MIAGLRLKSDECIENRGAIDAQLLCPNVMPGIEKALGSDGMEQAAYAELLGW